MVGLQAEKGELIEADELKDNKAFVLHLIHEKAYEKASEMAHGKTVLDLGCNTGYGSHILSSVAQKIIGVDVSEKAIKVARELYGPDNIEFQVIDGKKLPFADGGFDLITSFQVVEHIVAHEAYLQEIKRVLSPGGCAIFTTPNRSIRLYPGMKPWNDLHVTEYEAAELKKLLGDYFSNVELLGLFAEEPLYGIELARVSQKRQRSKIKQDKTMNPFSKGIVLFALNLKASLQKRLRSEKNFQQKYSTADLFFEHENLDKALDLMAICRNTGQEQS